MKRFLINLLGISAIVFAVIMGYELWLMTKPNLYKYKRQYIEQHLDDISVLLLGNSHIYHGLIPELLGDSAYNFALPGRAPYYDAKLAERYVPRMKNLRCVIIDYGYNIAYKSIVEDYVDCMMEKYMGIHPPTGLPYTRWLELASGMPWKTNLGKVECDSLGFFVRERPYGIEDWQHYDNSRPADYDDAAMKKLRDENVENYRSIKRVCEEHGVRFVVLTSPCYETYETDERGLSELQRFIDDVGAEYYNYFFDPRLSDADYYSDASHLRGQGAKAWSEIVRREVLLRCSE